MSPTTQPVHGAPIELGTRKGTINAPLTPLLPAIPLFIGYRSPSGLDRRGTRLGLMRASAEPLMLDLLATPLGTETSRTNALVMADDPASALAASP